METSVCREAETASVAPVSAPEIIAAIDLGSGAPGDGAAGHHADEVGAVFGAGMDV